MGSTNLHVLGPDKESVRIDVYEHQGFIRVSMKESVFLVRHS